MDKRDISAVASQASMSAGAVLGFWFIVEYLVLVLSTEHIYLNLIRVPMLFATPLLLTLLSLKFRKIIFQVTGQNKIMFLQLFIFGIQAMFFGGLLEAFLIFAYNSWLFPTNLYDMRQALIAQYTEVGQMLQTTGSALGSEFVQTFNEARDLLKEAPLERPIDAALSALSNDVFYGMCLMVVIALILRKK